MSATQRALDGLVEAFSRIPGARVAVVRPGLANPADSSNVVLSPLTLTRVGRSRRAGSLLDLELVVAVEASGETIFDLTEQLLLIAETLPHTRLDPLPENRSGFGLVIGVGVSLDVLEPTGPPVREVEVDVHPLTPAESTGLRLVPPTQQRG